MKINTFLPFFFSVENCILRRKTCRVEGEGTIHLSCMGYIVRRVELQNFCGFCQHVNTPKFKRFTRIHSQLYIIFFWHNSVFTVLTHGMPKERMRSWLLHSLLNHGKEGLKGKWKKSNIYGNNRCILNISLSEPLYFQRLKKCYTELLGKKPLEFLCA